MQESYRNFRKGLVWNKEGRNRKIEHMNLRKQKTQPMFFSKNSDRQAAVGNHWGCYTLLIFLGISATEQNWLSQPTHFTTDLKIVWISSEQRSLTWSGALCKENTKQRLYQINLLEVQKLVLTELSHASFSWRFKSLRLQIKVSFSSLEETGLLRCFQLLMAESWALPCPNSIIWIADFFKGETDPLLLA